jgi:hypothetical protein
MEKKLTRNPINLLKVVLFGPESTEKTTLSRQLARQYNTVWAPEFAREYLQNKWNNQRKICEKEDLIPIAIGQMKIENTFAKKAVKAIDEFILKKENGFSFSNSFQHVALDFIHQAPMISDSENH